VPKNPIRRYALIIAPAALYLSLPILGWGGFASFFSHPALDALAAEFLLLTVAGVLAGANLSAGVREDRGNRWVLAALGAVSLLGAYLPAYTDRLGLWTLGGDSVRWWGVAIVAAGGVLRVWPVYVLGHRFSGLVAIQPGHTLATDGIYGVVRNPSYLGGMVAMLGWALAFRSGVGLLLAALLVPPLIARIHAEERLLRSQFGVKYDAYCARTPRLIPGIY
jgi:protein-S-isoprenylcysteine O-methyltransferase Ste14